MSLEGESLFTIILSYARLSSELCFRGGEGEEHPKSSELLSLTVGRYIPMAVISFVEISRIIVPAIHRSLLFKLLHFMLIMNCKIIYK